MASDNIFVTTLALGGAGPTVAVKDCIDIAGWPTSSGSETLAEEPPAAAHADVVANILAKGARITGKANMHELAYGVTGVNRWLGTPINPNYPTLIPGGSSSGSAAAVAAGLVDIAIGTDTGGSIRMPATCCGVFGLKPTFGRVSRAGCSPAESSLDCVGPFARDVAGLETGMALIDPSFTAEPAPKNLRLGLVQVEADPEVTAALTAALAKVSSDVVPVTLTGLDAAFQAGITIMAAECWQSFGALTEDSRMGPDVHARLLAAREVTPAQVEFAEQVRASFAAAVDRALEEYDALVLPTLPALPPALDELGDAARMLRLTSLIRPFNLTGHPALSLPIESSTDRPVAMQLVGRRGADAQLCAVAHVVADAL